MSLNETQKLPILTETNFTRWKAFIIPALQAKGINIETFKFNEENAESIKNNAKALLLLRSTLSHAIFNEVSEIDDAAKTWNVLQVNHGMINEERRFRKIVELMSLKKGNHETIAKFCSRAQRLHNEINVLKTEDGIALMPDLLLYAAIASGVSEEERNLMYSWKANEIALDRIIDGCNLQRCKSKAQANHVQRSSGSSCRTCKKEACKKWWECKEIVCKKCQKKGHIKRNCTKNEANSVGFGVCHEWLIDTACTHNICNDISLLVDIRQIDGIELGVTKKDQIMKAEAVGSAVINVIGGHKIALNEVYYIPDSRRNLISYGALEEDNENLSAVMKDGTLVLFEGGIEFLSTKRINRMYPVQTIAKEANYVHVQLQHERLGHIGNEVMKKMGISQKKIDCQTCRRSNHKTKKFAKEKTWKAEKVFQHIHTDLCGEIQVISRKDNKSFQTIIDEKSKYVEVFGIKRKGEMLENIQTFYEYAKKKHGDTLEEITSDGAKELNSKKFSDWEKQRGIRHNTTAPYAHNMNGLVERAHGTLMKIVRSLLHQFDLPECLWEDALNVAVYLYNITRRKDGIVPYKLWNNREPSLKHLKVFGCAAWVRIPKERRKKLDPQAELMMFIGYHDEKGTYKFLTNNGDIVISRDAKFIENKTPRQLQPNVDWNFEAGCEDSDWVESSDDEETIILSSWSENDAEHVIEDDTLDYEDLDVGNQDSSSKEAIKEDENENFSSSEEKSPETRKKSLGRKYLELDVSNKGRGLRRKQTSVKLKDYVVNSVEKRIFVPKNVKQAMQCDDSIEWKEAYDKEMSSMIKHDVWTIKENIPEDATVVDSLVLFNVKLDSDANIEKKKVRFVARGNTQVEGKDYFEVYSPVMRQESERIIRVIAIERGLTRKHIDISTAFLHGELQEDIYMKPPAGSGIKGYCKLNMAIYGLRQSPRQFYLHVKKVLATIGFYSSSYDKCVFIRKHEQGHEYIGTHVDDFYVAVKPENYGTIAKKIGEVLAVKELGDESHWLGVKVETVDKNEVQLSQIAYVEKLLSDYGMQKCKPSNTPLDLGITSAILESPIEENEWKQTKQLPYRKLIGELVYLSMKSRPDISVAVSMLARYVNRFGFVHWKSVKRILRYLKNTKNYKLGFKPEGLNLEAYADSDWSNDVSTRRSRTGYCFYFGGVLVSWKTKIQKSVALSTMEAEYMALCDCVAECVWMRNFIEELGIAVGTTLIYEDNQSCISFAQNPNENGRARHIDRKYHFTREKVEEKLVKLKYCPTEQMIADGFTKVLDKKKHYAWLGSLKLTQTSGGVGMEVRSTSGGELE